ncbi:hypothetical protein PEC301296_08570 [Pectobacterium carotovorum subsp. carotovorum]|nr:hypothetical protein GZ59_32170 [Pectobacterium atrosepticum]KMK88324.1 hypothetical protein KCQ_00430 [Pectobacterium atrosepticum ICMP 1526]POW31595.1 hypothetical protein PB72LOC_01022 [Pectobacterium atrosepticum]GKV84545.1 hypothetical protein PEC301296_08570 [Pectobacterium carotovorum subsp. carotovorum]
MHMQASAHSENRSKNHSTSLLPVGSKVKALGETLTYFYVVLKQAEDLRASMPE